MPADQIPVYQNDIQNRQFSYSVRRTCSWIARATQTLSKPLPLHLTTDRKRCKRKSIVSAVEL